MRNSNILLSFLGVLTLLMGTQASYADWGQGRDAGHHAHQYFHYHDRPHFGYHVGAFYPDEYYWVTVGGSRYYYDDGIYYNYAGGDYVVVNPPIGAVVSAIPSDFQPVVINGMTYYVDNGVYYVHTSNGYQVVSQPVQAAPETVVNAQSAFTVNVPNNGGGYTAITLRRSGNGFVGPQGEFYSQFPHISQLRTMYGR